MRLLTALTALALFASLSLQAATTPLTKAIRLEQFDEAKKHITAELINKPDDGKYHPLTYAVYTGNNELIASLLKAGAKPNTIEHDTKTALYIAAQLNRSDAINLLHKHGAKYPTDATSPQPAKAAVKANAPEALKALLKNYPHLDLQQDWLPADQFTVFKVGSPLNHAMKYGYNEIGDILINHGCNTDATLWIERNVYVAGPDWRGKKAIHIACENNNISAKLVSHLIDLKCDPFETIPGLHIEPLTALDYAAASGSMEKVVAILTHPKLRNKATKSVLTRAMFIASAHNKPKITNYLLKQTNTNQPVPEKWLAKFGSKTDLTRGHSPLRESKIQELTQIVPNIKNSVKAESKVAIIAPQQLQNIVSLLTATLSRYPEITLLDREKLDLILSESALTDLQDNNQRTDHKQLNLIPAENMIILNDRTIKEGGFIEVSVIHSQTGIVTARIAASKDQLSQENQLKVYADHLRNKIKATSLKHQYSTAITSIPIKPESPNATSLGIAHDVNTVLPYLISNTQNFAHLSRKQLSRLEMEKTIGVKGSYWQAAWVIDGSIQTTKRNAASTPYSINLYATNPQNKQQVSITHQIKTADITAEVKQAWSELKKQIEVNPSPIASTPNKATESTILAENAKWYQAANYPEEAHVYAQAALALDPKKNSVYPTLIESKIQILPLATRQACNHINKRPRTIEIEKRYILARHIHQYSDLAHTAIRYAETIQQPLLLQKGGSQPGQYNTLIHRCLRELRFFRSILDDTIVQSYYSEQTAILDAQIKKLLDTYLEKIMNHPMETSTIVHLLDEDKDFYYFHKTPQTYQKFIQRLQHCVTTAKHNDLNTNLTSLTIQQLTWLKDNNQSQQVWLPLIQAFKQSKVIDYQIFAAILESQQTKKRSHQVALQHQILALEILNLRKNPRKFATPSLNPHYFLLDSDFPRIPIFNGLSILSCTPVGSLAALVDIEPEKLLHTAELQRVWGLYLWRTALQQLDHARWGELITEYKAREPQFKKNPGKRSLHSSAASHIPASDWKLFSQIYETKSKQQHYINQSLKKLSQENNTKQTGTQNALKASHIIPLAYKGANPQLGAFYHYGEASISGDEVWIPVSLIQERQSKPLDHSKHHIIQVINLQNSKSHTIKLPDTTADDESYHRKSLIAGKTHYYYRSHINRQSGEKLFAISRHTYQVKEIKLPHHKIKAISHKSHDDTICVSVVSEQKNHHATPLNQVFLIKGDQIIKTLVSSTRKPQQSPLDRPATLVKHILHEKDKITLFSINKTHHHCSIYHTKSQSWSSLPTQKLRATYNHIQDSINQDHLKDRNLTINGALMYFKKDYNWKKQKPSLALSYSQYYTDSGIDTTQSYVRRVNIDIPTVNHPLFEKPITCYRVSDLSDDGQSEIIRQGRFSWPGWWYSPNELIKKKIYGIHVIGLWKNHIVISLASANRGLPAIWLIKQQDIGKCIKQQTRKIPRPISFNDQNPGSVEQINYPHVRIEADKQYTSIWKNLGVNNSRGLRLKGGETHEILLTAQGDFQEGFTHIHFCARRWRRKNPFKFRILALVNEAWVEVHNADKTNLGMSATPNINVTFPQTVQQIKIQLTSHPNNSVMIDDLILR